MRDRDALRPPALLPLPYVHGSRASPEVQARFEAAETDTSLSCWMDVAGEVQREVLLGLGVPPAELPRALAAMRAAPYHHPELQPLCVYHRATRIRREGSCRLGEEVPELTLLRLVAAAGGGAGGCEPVLQEVRMRLRGAPRG